MHLEEKMRLTIKKTKMWFLIYVASFLEQLVLRKTFSIAGRRKQWNGRWEIRLCRELWMGQTPGAVTPIWTWNCFCLKSVFLVRLGWQLVLLCMHRETLAFGGQWSVLTFPLSSRFICLMHRVHNVYAHCNQPLIKWVQGVSHDPGDIIKWHKKRLKWELRWLSWPHSDKPFTGYSWIAASLAELLIVIVNVCFGYRKIQSLPRNRYFHAVPTERILQKPLNSLISLSLATGVWGRVNLKEILLTRGRKINLPLLTESQHEAFGVGLENAFCGDGSSLDYLPSLQEDTSLLLHSKVHRCRMENPKASLFTSVSNSLLGNYWMQNFTI